MLNVRVFNDNFFSDGESFLTLLLQTGQCLHQNYAIKKIGHRQEGGGVSRVTSGSVLTASMTSRLALVTFKMAVKVVVDEADKTVEFLMDILINFRRFGDGKIPIVIETQNLVPLLDETFRSLNFNDSLLTSSKSAEQ